MADGAEASSFGTDLGVPPTPRLSPAVRDPGETPPVGTGRFGSTNPSPLTCRAAGSPEIGVDGWLGGFDSPIGGWIRPLGSDCRSDGLGRPSDSKSVLDGCLAVSGETSAGLPAPLAKRARAESGISEEGGETVVRSRSGSRRKDSEAVIGSEVGWFAKGTGCLGNPCRRLLSGAD